MSDIRYDRDYLKLARLALKESKNIPYFAYWRKDVDLGDHWAFTVSVNRDSDILSESNWEVISSDMIKRFPKSVLVDDCNHWACGWIKYLTVRMIDSRGRLTMAGIAILDWQEKLNDYPVANEDDYYRREYEAYSESMRESVKDIIWRDHEIETADNLPDNWQDTLIEAIRMSPDREVSHAYDVAWDHEGWFQDSDTVIRVAMSLGYVLPLESEESD